MVAACFVSLVVLGARLEISADDGDPTISFDDSIPAVARVECTAPATATLACTANITATDFVVVGTGMTVAELLQSHAALLQSHATLEASYQSVLARLATVEAFVNANTPPPPSAPPPVPPPAPPAHTGSSQATAFAYIAQADTYPDGTYWIRVSPTSTKQLVVKHWGPSTHVSRAWAMVMRKSVNPDSSIFTVGSVGSPTSTFDSSSSSTFKLADTELNYLTTASTNPSTWGVMLVPNWGNNQQGANNHLGGNLLRTDASSRAYPLGGSIISNAGDMIKSSMQAASYPTGSWDTALETNSHCGGTQVWANWESSESYKMRWISAGGCSYFNEGFNGVGPGEISGGIWAWAR